MQKQLFEEGKGLVAAIVITAVVFEAVFHRGSVLQNSSLSIVLWWMMLPGVIALQRWRTQTVMLERLVIGAVLGLAASGMLMYYLGLVGVTISVTALLAPLVLSAAALFSVWKKP